MRSCSTRSRSPTGSDTTGSSSPSVLLAAAAARTSRIGLGVAVSVLPFHHPLLVAEEYAMLDQLSGGRVMLGVGSGYLQHEFDGFDIGPWEKRARFDEALTVVTTAWRGEPFTFHGRYHHVTDTRIAVTPVQVPHPPLWVAILRAEAARHVGAQGRSVMLIPYATCQSADDLGPIAAEHRAGVASSTSSLGRCEVAAALHGYVSTNPAQARAESEPYLDRYVGSRLYARRRG